MKKTSPVFWFSFLALAIAPAYGWEYVDEWPIAGGNFHVKVGSWISSVQISVLDGQSEKTASLNRNQTNQPVPTVLKPKPRPRLGGPAKAEDNEPALNTHAERIEETARFLTNVVNQFIERWNSPRDASEAMQWVHPIEAECVLALDKQNGMLAIESATNTPDSAEMVQIRKGIEPYNEPGEDYGKPFTTPGAEMDRLRKFLLSLAPLKIPNCLVSLPGNPLRIRLSVKVVKISSTAGLTTTPPPATAPDPNTNQVTATATAAANVEHSGISSTYTPNPGQFTRPIPQDELLKHTDVADPVYQYVIGFRYLEGDGLQMDPVLALHWFTKAAEQGYAPAQSQLGFMYHASYGVPHDSKKALHWYRKAAEQNYIQAIFNISIMYQNGDGVARDMAEAVKWIRKGAELGDSGCQAHLAWLYTSGEGMAKEPREAFHWYMKAALQGNTFAQFTVGTKYEDGLGIPRDEVEALAWYHLSPTNGLDEKINHRVRLERALGPEAAAAARCRAEKLRQKITQKS